MNNIKSITENQVKEEMRSKIAGLQSAMEKMPQIEIPIQHHFATGIYLREMTMPKGSTVVGKIHKTEHMCILAKGHVTVVNENGRETFQAPAVIHSTPGVKRALHALEETVWINVHHNPGNIKDESEIENFYVVDTFEQFLEHQETLKLEGGK